MMGRIKSFNNNNNNNKNNASLKEEKISSNKFVTDLIKEDLKHV